VLSHRPVSASNARADLADAPPDRSDDRPRNENLRSGKEIAMKGAPGVTTYNQAGKENIYAFVRGDNGRLYDCYWNQAVFRWLWDDRGQPPTARVNSSPGVIASQMVNGPQLHAFVRGNDGHLYERYWDGFGWVSWVDHGQPSNTSLALAPGVLGYRRAAGDVLVDAADRLHAFCWAADRSTEFLVRYSRFDGAFSRVGATATAANVVTEPGVIARRELTNRAMYAFVIGNDGRLSVSFSAQGQESPWFATDLGTPAGRTLHWLRPGVAVLPPTGVASFFSFVSASDGHLWGNIWAGPPATSSTFVDLGAPPGTTVGSAPSVVNFRFGSKDFLYVFLQGANGHLFVFRWDGGTDRLWADLGQAHHHGSSAPANAQAGDTRVTSAPGATAYRFVEPTRTTDRMYAFVLGADNHLHVCYWDGVDEWLWTDLRDPSLIGLAPSAINFGPVPIGDIATQAVTITNLSETTTLTVSFPGSSGVFRWDAFNRPMAPGQTATVLIDFSPTGLGASHTTLTVTSGAQDSPHSISIGGRGVRGQPQSPRPADHDEAGNAGRDALAVNTNT
jgi:hypothetical protein